jgi:hypothetical protein
MTKELSVFKGKTDIAARQKRVGQGSQNVSAEDMAIPRLKLLQLISEEVMPSSPKFIEGAQAGMFMNSVTSQLHNSLFVINLHFSRKTVVWKKRKSGGGMFGTYADEPEALAALEAAGENVNQYDIAENPTHLVMILSDEGKPSGVALLDMPGSKVKKSKIWNTNINKQEEAGLPRFGCVWELAVVAESNSSGPFSNVDVKFIVNAPDDIYAAAEAAYDAFFATSETATVDEVDEAA